MTPHDPTTQPDQKPATPIGTVVLVGHCGADRFSLSRAVASILPGVTVKAVNDRQGLSPHHRPDTLLLVNRVLDGRFDAGSGVGLIQQLAEKQPAPRMMLISNYPDAQAQAVKAGALPGFGKSELGDPETARKLRALAGA